MINPVYVSAEQFDRLSDPRVAAVGAVLHKEKRADELIPLVRIPERYALVKVDLIKEARRIVARYYVDRDSAGREIFDCMFALDQIADWKEGEECILPEHQSKAMIAAKGE